MFRKAKPTSKLDERLREIEREAEKIQSNIKALNKAVDHSDGDSMAKLAPRAPVVPAPPQHVPAPQPAAQTADDAGYEANPSLPGPLAGTNGGYFDRYQESQSDGRFAHYLRATGFSSEILLIFNSAE